MIVGLDAARADLLAYMIAAGARAAISRKVDGAWTDVVEAAPVLVESKRSSADSIAPERATAHDANARSILLPFGADVRAGDQLRVTAPRGSGTWPGQVLTIGSVDLLSLAPGVRASAVIAENAVEQYDVRIERWSDADAAYLPALTARAYVVTDRTTNAVNESGATGQRSTGALVFDPAPSEPIRAQDSVVGIPWARGAYVTRVHPVVGSRLDVSFAWAAGDGGGR